MATFWCQMCAFLIKRIFVKKNNIIFILLGLCINYCVLADGPLWRKGYPYNKDEMIKKLGATNFDTFLRIVDYSLSGYALYSAACLAAQTLRFVTQPEYKKLDHLSAEKVIFAPLTPYCQKKLAAFDSDAFSALIEKKLDGYSQEEQLVIRKKIVTQYNLYQFSGFIGAIASWPEFKHHISCLAVIFEQDEQMRKPFLNIQGFEKDAFFDFIKTYHTSISNQP